MLGNPSNLLGFSLPYLANRLGKVRNMATHDEFTLEKPQAKATQQASAEDAKAAFPNAVAVLEQFRAAFGQDVKLLYASEGGKTIGNPTKYESGRFLTVDRYLALGKKPMQLEKKGRGR